MLRLSPLTLLFAVSGAALSFLSAQPAGAQSGPYAHYNRAPDQGWRAPSWWDQRDRPGDYRCDAYWDANRTDCQERWRDQRPHQAANRPYRGHGHAGYGHAGGHVQRHDHHRYASAARGANVWQGAYGRPDLVYPAQGHGHAGGRDPRRIDWCRATWRSYNPATGYYRAYSGRLVYCG